MDEQASRVRADVLSWLLEGDDPSVRYFTLTDLLGHAPDFPASAAARRRMTEREERARRVEARAALQRLRAGLEDILKQLS